MIPLSPGMIRNLWESTLWYRCETCGDEQKQECEKADECLLKIWLEELEEKQSE